MSIMVMGWEEYQKRSCDGGMKPNERKNEEKLGCKLSSVWFGDGKIVRQDYPLKSPWPPEELGLLSLITRVIFPPGGEEEGDIFIYKKLRL